MEKNPDRLLGEGDKIAVTGVSSNPKKWSSVLFNSVKSLGFKAYPINPKHSKIRGDKVYPNIASLPEKPDVVITVTPSRVTEKTIEECVEIGVGKVWMQPGSESKRAVELCKENDIRFMQNSCFFNRGVGMKQSFSRVSFACKNITHEDLVRCSFNLNRTDYNLLIFLMEDETERTATDIANRMGLERTTVQKAVKNLLRKQLVIRFRKNLSGGGYTYFYTVRGKDEIKNRMKDIVREWYQDVKKGINDL